MISYIRAVKNLVDPWKGVVFNRRRVRYILPGDQLPEKNVLCCRSYKEFISKTDLGLSASDHRIHLGLVPVPYGGNLRKATIFFLMLNPRFRPMDYYAETHDPAFLKARIDSLRQQNTDIDFPFIALNPTFSYHPTYDWWTRKLKPLIRRLKDEDPSSNDRDILKELSSKIGVLECFPYHSNGFIQADSGPWILSES